MEKMTAHQAIRFDRYSRINAIICNGTAKSKGCTCEAYQDWFTYARWQAQGYQVRKGEHGTKIETYAPITKKGDDGETEIIGKRPWTSTVFCRCQVDKRPEN